MLPAGDVRDGTTVKLSAVKDGLSFNGKQVVLPDDDNEA